MAKIIGQDTLKALACDIARLHKPITFDWTAKFGLPKEPPAVPRAEPAALMQEAAQLAAEPEQKPRQKLICHSCGAAVGYSVAKFCWFNKPKFGGNIYCMDCQKITSAA